VDATGLKSSARELAAFGQVYLDGGRWQNQQIVPEACVNESTRALITVPDTPPDQELGYGYQWVGKQTPRHPGYAAVGFGGQRIFVVPDLDMVAVDTQDSAPSGTRPIEIVDDMYSIVYVPHDRPMTQDEINTYFVSNTAFDTTRSNNIVTGGTVPDVTAGATK